MIPDGKEITPGMTVQHDEGLLYRVEDVRASTDGYETAHRLGGMVVNYTQLQGGSYPAGTKWSKSEAGFRKFFTPVDSEEFEPRFYPFSLVLGLNFRHAHINGILQESDKEVRARLTELTGPANPQVTGRLLNILLGAKVGYRKLPQIETHEGHGVTFHDPEGLYDSFNRRGYVGPVMNKAMRTLIENATQNPPLDASSKLIA